MRDRQRQERDAGEDENYFISLSDLMTGVVFIFVILLCAFAFHYQAAHEEMTKVTREIAALHQKANAARLDAEQRASEAMQAWAAAQEAARAKALAEAARRAAEEKASGAEAARKAAEEKASDAEQAELAAKKAAEGLLKQGEQVDALTKLLRQRDEVLRKILTGLVGRLSEGGVRVQLDPANGVLRLPDGLLFESGSDVLKLKGAEALRLLARELAPVLRDGCSHQSSFRFEAVFIEGHTDDVKIRNARFSDNWDLSTSRATGTYRALVKERPELEFFLNPAGLRVLGVSGYGENRPVATNLSEEGRARNRRIDLRFLMAYPSNEDLKKLEALLPVNIRGKQAGGSSFTVAP